MEKDYSLLLAKTNIILEKYDAISKLKEKFNIFEILNLENLEVKLHSFLIYSLIKNPKENYLYENFFKYFLEIVLGEKYDSSKNYEVAKEHKIYNGRIDFYIKTNEEEYAIEMKIYSVDSEGQLKKYQNYLKNHNKKYKLFYLTLFGDEPIHKENQEVEPVLISFKKHISKWLKKCIEKSYESPKIRETLNQYLFTINKLTNNIQEEGKEMELKELLLKDNNLKTAMELTNVIEEVKEEIKNKFWRDLENEISILEEKEDYDGENICEIVYYKKINSKNKKLCFGLSDMDKYNISFYIGFCDKDNNWLPFDFLKKEPELRSKFEKIQQNLDIKYTLKDKHIFVYKYVKNSGTNFNINEDFYNLLDENTRKNLIKDLAEYIEDRYREINEIFD